MKLTVKTLKGGKFDIEVEETNTVAQVKAVIEKSKPELPASSTKLIHSGKVLGKDDETLTACGVKANDFLVVMVAKVKKAAAAPAPAAATATAPPATAEKPAATPAAAPAATPATATTPAPPAATSAPVAPPAPTRTDDFPAEIVTNLTSMGFPEAEVRHCLRAAQGNPDIAMEFLTNGIPDSVARAASGDVSSSPSAGSTGGSSQPLQSLRNHPQFNDLRRLVQSNPQMLQQVLTQIGQQQPQLLQEINANQALFLQMMNEPVTNTTTAPTSSSSTSSAPAPSAPALPAGMEGMSNPAQMAQMIQSMGPEELNQMAAMMGLSPDQLRTTAQMIGQMPEEQLSQFMMQAMGGAGPEALGGMMGNQQVLRLTEEEMAAVDRLAEMGFDRSEAAQAFLACDKDEALAANLLMDSMGDGGFFGGGGGGGNGGGGGANGDDDDGDDMYD